jgi:hypothetical protein
MKDNMIKISHEVPKNLLPWSKTVNDYEYILPYFYVRDQKYKDFYIQCKDEGRFSILDNGLFEGETYTTEVLCDFIRELTPDIFIIPDEWNDYLKTFGHAKEWSELITLSPSTKGMVVLQGESFEEIRRLYKWCYELGYRHFALNHSSISYDNIFPHKNVLVSKMMGRIQLVHYLSNIIKNDVYIHLLGCSLPQEFMYYDGYNFIKSVDTSNPILMGASKKTYNRWGEISKPKDKMEKYFYEDMEPYMNEIISNVKEFKKIINK